MRSQAYATGETFILDIYEVYEYTRLALQEELGAGVFNTFLETVVSDTVMFIFHGDQSRGERAIERQLKKYFIDEIRSIQITRELFDRVYASLGVKCQQQLIGNYDYSLNSAAMTLSLRCKLSNYRRTVAPTVNDVIEDIDLSIEQGDWVPEKLRRTLDDFRT